MRFVIVCLLTLIFVSCEPFDFRLKLVNKTNYKVRYFYSVMNEQEIIPNWRPCDSLVFDYILPKEEEIIKSTTKWDFKLKNHPNKILRIYILNEDTFRKYTTCEFVNGKTVYYKHDDLHNYNLYDVFKYQLFLKRYDLKFDDLIKADWEIIYDGK